MATLDDLLSVLQGASNSAASTVSAPVDGINWILKKAGFPVSDKPVGGSDWLKDKGLMADPKNQNMGYVGEAIGGVLPMVAAAKAPQIASSLNQMGANMAAPRTLNPQTGAIVWHGSPHKFDKFDASKIGTGEGAQAYGHGLYVAESKDVAQGYKNALSPGMGVGDADTVSRVLRMNGGDLNAAADDLAMRAKYANIPGGKEKLLQLSEKVRAGWDPSGALYKIDLPDEHIAKMLDWDKPLSQQAPEVQRFFSDVSRPPGADMPVGEWLKPRFAEGAAPYWSDDMRKVGIPGIRYLDGGSRGTGAGTSNFVIFPGNENLLRILERNGIPLD